MRLIPWLRLAEFFARQAAQLEQYSRRQVQIAKCREWARIGITPEFVANWS